MARATLGLVLTGGTVGSTSAGDEEVVRLVRGPAATGVPSWLSGSLSGFGPHSLAVRRPIQLHSEEARPRHWEQLADACRALVRSGAGAILVLHGSDTMAYSAAALAYALADLEVPIVLTGSNLPPDAPDSDARHNVATAVTALRSLPAGVFLSFAGRSSGPAAVHLGTRVRKERASGRAFVSPNGGAIGRVAHGRLETLLPIPAPRPPDLPAGAAREDRFDPRVLELRVHPGMPFAALESAVVAGGLRGVAVELYPCATGPTGDDDASLERFARFVSDRGGVVVATVAAAPLGSDAYYPSLPTLTGAGVTFLPGVLTSAATVKLMWALSATRGDAAAARGLLRRPIAGEIAPASVEASPLSSARGARRG